MVSYSNHKLVLNYVCLMEMNVDYKNDSFLNPSTSRILILPSIPDNSKGTSTVLAPISFPTVDGGNPAPVGNYWEL